MADRFEGLKAFFPGAPREWVERLIESDDNTDELTGGGGQINVSDNGQDVTPITVTKTQTPSGDGTNAANMVLLTDSALDYCLDIRTADEERRLLFRPDAFQFVPKEGSAAINYICGVRPREATDDNSGGNLYIGAGASTTQNGGDFILYGGGSTSATEGVLKLAPFLTSVVEIGAAAIPTDIKGELTIGGIKFLVVTASPDGSVTAPRGSIATNTTDGALYSNTDGGTTWVAR